MSDKEGLSPTVRSEIAQKIDRLAQNYGLPQPFRKQYVDEIVEGIEHVKIYGRWPDEFNGEEGESEANRAQE